MNKSENNAGSILAAVLPEKTLQTRTAQIQVNREIHPAPPRFRNEIAKFIVRRDNKCIRCGTCVKVCPNGVHVLKSGYKYFAAARSHVCIGPSCSSTDHYCVDLCPSGALRMVENPAMKALGDYRWTSDMILATWKMAETGAPPPPEYNYEYETGASGGGLDRLRFRFPEKPPVALDDADIDTSLELNRRHDDLSFLAEDLGGNRKSTCVKSWNQQPLRKCTV